MRIFQKKWRLIKLAILMICFLIVMPFFGFSFLISSSSLDDRQFRLIISEYWLQTFEPAIWDSKPSESLTKELINTPEFLELKQALKEFQGNMEMAPDVNDPK